MSSPTEVPNQAAEAPPPQAPSGDPAAAARRDSDPDSGDAAMRTPPTVVGMPVEEVPSGAGPGKGAVDDPEPGKVNPSATIGDAVAGAADPGAEPAPSDGKGIAEPAPRKLPDYLRARKPRRKVELAGSKPRSGPCVYCKDEVDSADHAWCVRCKVFLHRDCADELGQCPTLGCSGDLLKYKRQPLESHGHRGLTILGLTVGQIAYWLVSLGVPIGLAAALGEFNGIVALLGFAFAFMLHVSGFRGAVDFVFDSLPLPSFSGLRSSTGKTVQRGRELGPGPPVVLVAGLVSTWLSGWPPGLEGDGLADPAARACLAVTLLGTVLMIALRDPRQAVSETAESHETESEAEAAAIGALEPEQEADRDISALPEPVRPKTADAAGLKVGETERAAIPNG